MGKSSYTPAAYKLRLQRQRERRKGVGTGVKERCYRYGILPAEYDRLRKQQDYRCALCGLSEDDNLHGVLYIDHSHTTGTVRGLLCSECNSGLGKFRDNPALLRKAAEYLL